MQAFCPKEIFVYRRVILIGALVIDLPATFLVDTCLLPWDMVTLIRSGAAEKKDASQEREH